jgi:hypothetical protein
MINLKKCHFRFSGAVRIVPLVACVTFWKSEFMQFQVGVKSSGLPITLEMKVWL